MAGRLTVGVASLLGAAALLVSTAAVHAQIATGVTVRGDCRTHLEEYLKKRNPGHFYYVEDPDSSKYGCGFSFEDPGTFDRYPSSAQIAFTFCQNGADERSSKSRCELMARGSTIVARSYQEAQSRQDGARLRSPPYSDSCRLADGTW